MTLTRMSITDEAGPLRERHRRGHRPREPDHVDGGHAERVQHGEHRGASEMRGHRRLQVSAVERPAPRQLHREHRARRASARTAARWRPWAAGARAGRRSSSAGESTPVSTKLRSNARAHSPMSAIMARCHSLVHRRGARRVYGRCRRRSICASSSRPDAAGPYPPVGIPRPVLPRGPVVPRRTMQLPRKNALGRSPRVLIVSSAVAAGGATALAVARHRSPAAPAAALPLDSTWALGPAVSRRADVSGPAACSSS